MDEDQKPVHRHPEHHLVEEHLFVEEQLIEPAQEQYGKLGVLSKISASAWIAAIVGLAVLILVGYTSFKVIQKVNSISQSVASQDAKLKNVSDSVDTLSSTVANLSQPSGGQNQPDPNKVYSLQIQGSTPALGDANAPVTVVEYADYQCPFCERFYSGTFPDLKSKYIDTGKVKFIYQDYSFLGPDSTTAAEAAQCANDQGKFWAFHDYLFSNQGQEGSAWAVAANEKKFAAAVGLKASTFATCLDSGKYASLVQQETASGKAVDVSATPTVFVNGHIIVGAQPTETFEAAIDKELNK